MGFLSLEAKSILTDKAVGIEQNGQEKLKETGDFVQGLEELTGKQKREFGVQGERRWR